MKKQNAEVLELGKIVITQRAKETLHYHEVLSALFKHAHEPWGKSFLLDDDSGPEYGKECRHLTSNHLSLEGQPFRIATETLSETTTVFFSDETDRNETSQLEDWICRSGCRGCGP